MKLKRGTIREDGMVFWRYNPSAKNGEHWVTQDQIIQLKEKHHKRVYEYRKKNIEKVRASQRKCYYKTKEKQLARQKEYRKTIRAKINEYEKRHRENNPIVKCCKNIRDLIGRTFRDRGYSKKSKTADILGCSFEEFKMHIESQFQPGMSWENRNLWHIDHIMPISMAKTYDEIVRLNHYRNLRPLWAYENKSKGNKAPEILVLF